MPRPKRDLMDVAKATVTPPDTLSATASIACVKQNAGNNLFRVVLPGGDAAGILAELPARFRNTIWIKLGNYVVVDTSSGADRANKIGGEIANVVRNEKAWRKMSYWPLEFPVKKSFCESESDDDDGPKMPSSGSEDGF